MDADKLVAMANQIASFFASEPDRELAVERGARQGGLSPGRQAPAGAGP